MHMGNLKTTGCPFSSDCPQKSSKQSPPSHSANCTSSRQLTTWLCLFEAVKLCLGTTRIILDVFSLYLDLRVFFKREGTCFGGPILFVMVASTFSGESPISCWFSSLGQFLWALWFSSLQKNNSADNHLLLSRQIAQAADSWQTWLCMFEAVKLCLGRARVILDVFSLHLDSRVFKRKGTCFGGPILFVMVASTFSGESPISCWFSSLGQFLWALWFSSLWTNTLNSIISVLQLIGHNN